MSVEVEVEVEVEVIIYLVSMMLMRLRYANARKKEMHDRVADRLFTNLQGNRYNYFAHLHQLRKGM